MNFVSIRIITNDINRMVAFYERVTGMSADRPVPTFAEFRTGVATLAIGSVETLQPFGGANVASPAANRSAIIEFQVDDVDADYRQLADLLGDESGAGADDDALGQPLASFPRPGRQLGQPVHPGDG